MHAVVLAATLVALLCLPCVVAAIVCAADVRERAAPTERAAWSERAAWTRGRRRETRALRRLDRSLADTLGVAVPAPRTGTAPGPTIEQIAADLRRLDRQRQGGIATESTAWSAAVLRAYDDRLCLASRCLGIAEHLEMLEGIDREIERVRVEGELQVAGLELRSVAHRPPDRLP
jgi:hypothetical protein